MKVKTFRNIFFATVAAYIALSFNIPFSAKDIFFRNATDTIINTGDFMEFVVYFLAVPFFVGTVVFFKHNKYLVMTKNGIAYFILGFVLLIILPYASYPSRTEITSQTITKHNLIGQVTDVYNIEDAESVTVGLKAEGYAGKYGTRAYLHFEYSVKFEDGYSYDFGNPGDDDLCNRIIDAVDKTIKEKGIEKKVIGDVYIRGNAPLYAFENYYDSIRPYLSRIEMLMYGKIITEEYEPEETWEGMEEPTYYNFLQ